MKKIAVYILLLPMNLILFNPSSAANSAIVAVYSSNVWNDSMIAFGKFLDWKGITHERITYAKVNTLDLKNYYKVLFIPGGDFINYESKINQSGQKHIRDLVNEGGGFIGICGGAIYACDSANYEGSTYDLSLNLFTGTAYGILNRISPTWKMTTITLNLNNPINQYQPATHTIMYAGGSAFYSEDSTIVDTVATYNEYYGHNAIINFNYGEGRVLLIGLHPEFEEDSNRDGTSFGDQYNDRGSEWGFLWSAMDWVLGNPITDSTRSSIKDQREMMSQESFTLFPVFPNPFNLETTIQFNLPYFSELSLKIYNLEGRLVRSLSDGQSWGTGLHRIIWDGKNDHGFDVSAGEYFCKVGIDGFIKTKKMLLLK